MKQVQQQQRTTTSLGPGAPAGSRGCAWAKDSPRPMNLLPVGADRVLAWGRHRRRNAIAGSKVQQSVTKGLGADRPPKRSPAYGSQ